MIAIDGCGANGIPSVIVEAPASGGNGLPLRLKLLKDLAFGMIPNRPGLYETAQIELLCPEHGHGGRRRVGIVGIVDGPWTRSRASTKDQGGPWFADILPTCAPHY